MNDYAASKVDDTLALEAKPLKSRYLWSRGNYLVNLRSDDVADGAEPATAPDPVGERVVDKDLPHDHEDDPRLEENNNNINMKFMH